MTPVRAWRLASFVTPLGLARFRYSSWCHPWMLILFHVQPSRSSTATCIQLLGNLKLCHKPPQRVPCRRRTRSRSWLKRDQKLRRFSLSRQRPRRVSACWAGRIVRLFLEGERMIRRKHRWCFQRERNLRRVISLWTIYRLLLVSMSRIRLPLLVSAGVALVVSILFLPPAWDIKAGRVRLTLITGACHKIISGTEKPFLLSFHACTFLLWPHFFIPTK